LPPALISTSQSVPVRWEMSSSVKNYRKLS
jgi:hypothetical protein